MGLLYQFIQVDVQSNERIKYRYRCSECVQKLNNEIQDLYSSYYKINYNYEPVYFDKEQEDR